MARMSSGKCQEANMNRARLVAILFLGGYLLNGCGGGSAKLPLPSLRRRFQMELPTPCTRAQPDSALRLLAELLPIIGVGPPPTALLYRRV